MVTIEVYKNSHPVDGANVDVYWGFGNMYGRNGKTGRDGKVHLDMEATDGKILVRNTIVHQGRISGRMVFHI